MTTPPDELTAETIEELERLEREAFRAPWTYDRWEVECDACSDGEPECSNTDCNGEEYPLVAIESPEEYPGGQLVAQITVPGLLCLADKNGAFLVALRNAAPALIASARLAAERGERIRGLAEAAESVLRHINEMMDECPFCDMPDEQHDPDCRCGALESALGKGEP